MKRFKFQGLLISIIITYKFMVSVFHHYSVCGQAFIITPSPILVIYLRLERFTGWIGIHLATPWDEGSSGKQVKKVFIKALFRGQYIKNDCSISFGTFEYFQIHYIHKINLKRKEKALIWLCFYQQLRETISWKHTHFNQIYIFETTWNM